MAENSGVRFSIIEYDIESIYGSTGTVGDAALAADGNGYVIRQSTTANSDGSTLQDILGYTPDGRFAFRNLITRSADGQSTLTRYDDDGNGTFDRSQRIELATDAGGSLGIRYVRYWLRPNVAAVPAPSPCSFSRSRTRARSRSPAPQLICP
ncbi:hypothetical protein [Sinorhizobium prairiense]|uniref:hypothetical protein n=1 Tax=unclassified Sinorhizobium TaxID=2613772 RepID=UPI0023D85A90|nr:MULTISPECIES: hypothetical protein [unclassified Sinorhizobium]WEJ11166.1 hypothetical protein N0Q90_08715 [Sinorhizobium sp. M103]WEJ38150.1 hypothetical protein N0R80_08685 [Sinorhizobium sp. C101]